MRDLTDYSGKRIGIMTVLKKIPNSNAKWLCKCDCGEEVIYQSYELKKYKSCGCLKEKFFYGTTKGKSENRIHNDPLYGLYYGIKDRCYNPKGTAYDRYGGRGIKMCDEWLKSFENFRDWAYSTGYDKSKKGMEQSIDRIDVNGDYEPDNCRWSYPKEQARNRSNSVYITINNSQMQIDDFIEKYGIENRLFAYRRMKKGLSGEEIIQEWDIKNGKNQAYISMNEAMTISNLNLGQLYERLSSGKIQYKRIGRDDFILRNSLEDYLKR